MKKSIIQTTTLLSFLTLIIGFVACRAIYKPSDNLFSSSKSISIWEFSYSYDDNQTRIRKRKNYPEFVEKIKQKQFVPESYFLYDTIYPHRAFDPNLDNAASYHFRKSYWPKFDLQNILFEYVDFCQKHQFSANLDDNSIQKLMKYDSFDTELTIAYYYDSLFYKTAVIYQKEAKTIIGYGHK